MSNEQYFRECDLLEKQWRCRVNLNRKTNLVNLKLAKWHRENRTVVNIAEWRIENARRKTMGRIMGATA